MINYICLIIVLLFSIKDDLKEGKIKNKYTFPMILIGALLYYLDRGLSFNTIASGVTGLTATFAIAIALFAFGLFGGGDGKLFLAISSLMGFEFFIGVLVYSVLLGAIYQTLKKSNKGLGQAVSNFLRNVYFSIRTLKFEKQEMNEQTKITMAIAIAFGVVFEVIYPLTKVIEHIQRGVV